MRTFAAFALIAASLAVTHEARAQGTYYPWCSRYDAYSYNCGFKTWQQCQANISGMGGYCYQNPMPGPVVESPASHRRKPKRPY